jgi:L-ascorbate metabolism protein UlaG (beta-lactamase superfamily)
MGMALAHKIILPSTGASADMSNGSIFFIGTATVLIRYAGFTVLTDPNFIHMHEKVDLGYGLSATRQTNPALEIHELPPVDFVLLSHFHGDHFDQVAEREIEKSLPIVTTPEAAAALRQRGFVAPQGLTTWEDISVVKDVPTSALRPRLVGMDHLSCPSPCPRSWAVYLNFSRARVIGASGCTLPVILW